MNELKPCPFCGTQKVNIRRINTGGYICYCTSCESEGGFKLDQNAAVEHWNTRAVLDETSRLCWRSASEHPTDKKKTYLVKVPVHGLQLATFDTWLKMWKHSTTELYITVLEWRKI